MAPKTRTTPTTKKPNKRPPAQKAKERDARADAYIQTCHSARRMYEAQELAYRPTRLEYFAAVALEGILAAPKPIRTEEGGLSITTNAIVIAKHVIEKLDAEQNTPRR